MEESELEQEFRKLVLDKRDLIYAKLSQANQLLNEAVVISEEFGIPFESYISQISQSFFPKSFNNKFGKLDIDLVENITGAYHPYPQYGGWEHSQICS